MKSHDFYLFLRQTQLPGSDLPFVASFVSPHILRFADRASCASSQEAAQDERKPG
jgi:hypothetical protein